MTRLLLHGGSIFDGTGAEPAVGDVVIEGERIVAVGSGLDGDEVIDCTGRAIYPGFIDAHVHVMLDGHFDYGHLANTPFSYNFYAAADCLRRTLAVGITTVRDAAGADLGVKEALQKGLIAGPRMQIAISMLSQTGGHGDGWEACGAAVPGILMEHPGRPDGIADGPDEMRRKVRELIRAGADVIKVATSGGVLSPRDDPRHGHYRDDELAVLMAEANAAGIHVMAHAQATDGIKSAVRAGIRSIEHGIYLDDEAIEMMLAQGTWLVPTLIAPLGVVEAADRGLTMPEYAIQKSLLVMDAHRESFRRAVEAGVRVAMGTDSGVTPHGQNLRELELMVDGGMSPAQALHSATRSAAELMGLADDLGTIEEGKRADLVIADGDPLDLVGLTDRIRMVIQDGKVVVTSEDDPQD